MDMFENKKLGNFPKKLVILYRVKQILDTFFSWLVYDRPHT